MIARAVVRDLYDGAAAAKVFAALMLVMGVAPVFAPLVGGAVLKVTSWRGVFGLLAFAALFAYISGSSFVLEDVYGVSPQAFSVVFAVNSAALIGLSQFSGQTVARLGARRLLSAGLALAVAAGLATLAATLAHVALGVLLACLVVLVGSNGLIVPNVTALALADQRERAGSASALLGLGQFGVAAAVAPLVGIAGAGTAIPMGVVIAVCVVLAAAAQLPARSDHSGADER